MPVYLSCLIAFVVTAALLEILRPLATRIGLLDQPGARKTHQGQVPLIGGVAMFCGFVFACLTLDLALTPFRSFFAASALLLVVGILDDFQELSSRARFCAQIAASLLMIFWGGVALIDLGVLWPGAGAAELGAWSVGFTVFATVGVLNALNMSDGIDGLAGGLSLIAFLGLGYVAHAAGLPDREWVLLLLAAVVSAFLLFNMRLPRRVRPRAFMGDAGSLFLGFAMAWFFIDLSQGPARAMSPVTALWLFALPLFDAVWSIMRRVCNRRSPFGADVEHLHHLLQRVGMSVARSVWLMWALALVCAGVGLIGHRYAISEGAMFIAFLALFGLYCALIARAWRRDRFFGRPFAGAEE